MSTQAFTFIGVDACFSFHMFMENASIKNFFGYHEILK